MESIPQEWTFDAPEVAEAFDQHVREQLPWYDLATSGIAHIARHYIPDGGRVFDLGASTGNIGRALAPTLEARGASLVPVEVSPEMAKLYHGPGRPALRIEDATETDLTGADLIVGFLFTMFLPPARRQGFIERARASLEPGGAVLLVEKMLPGPGYPATILWRLALAQKIASGATPEQVIRKELSLGGVQRALDRSELPPGAVEWFRLGDFAGWLIER